MKIINNSVIIETKAINHHRNIYKNRNVMNNLYTY